MQYGVIQSVLIVEIYITKIPYTRSRTKFLSSPRSKYPTKSFLIQYSFFNKLREAAFRSEVAGFLTYFTALATDSYINNNK